MAAAAAKEFRFLITVTVTGTLKGMRGRASLSLRYGTLFPVATTKPAGTLGDEKKGGSTVLYRIRKFESFLWVSGVRRAAGRSAGEPGRKSEGRRGDPSSVSVSFVCVIIISDSTAPHWHLREKYFYSEKKNLSASLPY